MTAGPKLTRPETIMKTFPDRRFLPVLLMAFLLLPSMALAAPKIGKLAPDFTAVDSNGKTQHLADYKGKTVVLEWTNHDCPFVKKHYGAGNMQAQQEEAAAEGIVWLSIISSAPGKQGHVSAAEANRLSKERGAAPAAVVLDPEGDIGKLYGARTTPHMFLIDDKGILRYKGAIDSIRSARQADVPKATQYVRLALNEMRSGKKLSQPVSKPYGCSVKY